jgi:hypothetical protein
MAEHDTAAVSYRIWARMHVACFVTGEVWMHAEGHGCVAPCLPGTGERPVASRQPQATQ